MSASHEGQGAANSSPTPVGPRRTFIKVASLAIGAISGLAPVAFGIITFMNPLRRSRWLPERRELEGQSGPEGFTRITTLEGLAVNGPPQRFPVVADRVDAWNFVPDQPIGAVYIERTATNEVRVFNATCPHAGCSVLYDGSGFSCPCHNSSFQLDGSKRVSQSGRENPSLRGLDQLDVDPQLLAAGEIWVKFKNFYTGKAEKIEKI